MEKIEVNGEKTHPLFVYLRNNSSLYDAKTNKAGVIPWNFAKFFVKSEGKVINFFPPTTKVEEVESYIKSQLDVWAIPVKYELTNEQGGLNQSGYPVTIQSVRVSSNQIPYN